MRSPMAIDKIAFVLIYVAIAMIVMWAARSVTNYALDTNFYQNFLTAWEARLVAMRYKKVSWEPYDGKSPSDYMQSLIKVMQDNGLSPPPSNTEHRFIYRMNKFGDRSRQIMLLFHNDRLILYGLPQSTFNRLDRFIDGLSDPHRGHFTGIWSSDNITKIGTWKI